MNVITLHTDVDFANSIVPEGELLIFYALCNGKVVKRYKNID